MGLFDRIRNIIVTPATEWPVVANEAASLGSIYMGYIVPLAAVAEIAQFVGSAILDHSASALARAALVGVVFFLFELGMVYGTAYLASALANTFGAQRDLLASFKWAAYSRTPFWVAGVLAVIPTFGWIGPLLGGVYSLYLFWMGTIPMARIAPEKATPYAGTITAAYIIAYGAIYVILTNLLGVIVTAMANHH